MKKFFARLFGRKPALQTVFKRVGSKIPLGVLVRDNVSGFTGIAVGRIDALNGNVQYLVQPNGGAADYKDGVSIDYHTLEIIGDGEVDNVTFPAAGRVIQLGSRVRDVATGFEGIAAKRFTYMNGCVSYSVIPKAKDVETIPTGDWVDECRLVVVDDGVINDVVVAARGEMAERPAGGAPVRMPRGVAR